jgi:hypothetical protein
MSSASNLGYGNENPYNNSQFVNGTSTNNPANFSSNEIPKSSCSFKGGAKRLKNKIKNITKRYKMKGGKKSRRSLKRRIRSRAMGSSRSLARSMALAGGRSRSLARSMALAGGRRRKRTHRNMRGGYAQYQNNQPFSMGYSVGGVLGANESALATPAPIQPYNSAIDNYSRYTNGGFPSRGH